MATRKRRKFRRFGISIFHGNVHLGWLGAENEEKKDAIVKKAKKHSLVDRIEVRDWKTRLLNLDDIYETHIRINKKWHYVHSSQFQL